MKKLMMKINLAIIAVMASVPAFAAPAGQSTDGLCGLIGRMYYVFQILRTLAFVGAAFYIAGWAWDYISKGKAEMKDLKEKGTGLLVGFVLLFGIGIALSFFLSASGGKLIGCDNIIKGW